MCWFLKLAGDVADCNAQCVDDYDKDDDIIVIEMYIFPESFTY